jgi:SWI/SNF-related matrix-associated actin-dependent regulator of chromatin subfamily A3
MSGKTLQAIGLILANPPGNDEPTCTLIVCPVSVMAASWRMQIDQFCNAGDKHLSVDFFYGDRREHALLKAKDGKINVLLTSYHQLVSEMKMYNEQKELEEISKQRMERGEKPIKRKVTQRIFCYEVPFHRVILDEAHEIRNPDTQLFKACSALKTTHKLCLTGTPFVNRPSDIGSLLTFLKVKPLSDKDTFDEFITERIQNFKEIGLVRLRAIMAHVALRRNKELVESSLPAKCIQLVSVALTEGRHEKVLELFNETTRACIIGLFRVGGGALAGRELGAIFSLKCFVPARLAVT